MEAWRYNNQSTYNKEGKIFSFQCGDGLARAVYFSSRTHFVNRPWLTLPNNSFQSSPIAYLWICFGQRMKFRLIDQNYQSLETSEKGLRKLFSLQSRKFLQISEMPLFKTHFETLLFDIFVWLNWSLTLLSNRSHFTADCRHFVVFVEILT